MNQKSTPRALGYCMAIAGGVLWAVSGACGQELYRINTVTTAWLIPVRLILAGLLYLIVAQIVTPGIFHIWKDPKNIPTLILYGCFGSCASQFSFFSCIEHANVALATVLCYLCPIMILFHTMIKERRLPKLYELSAVCLTVVGVFACSTHFDLTTLIVSPIALIMGILCAVTAAVNTVAPLRLMEKYSNLCVIGWGMLAGGTVTAILFRPWTIHVTYDAPLFGYMSVIIICGTLLAFSLYMRGIQVAGVIAGNVLSSVEPLAAVIISVLFLNVSFTAEDFIGFALILLTVPIIAIGQNRSKNAQQ